MVAVSILAILGPFPASSTASSFVAGSVVLGVAPPDSRKAFPVDTQHRSFYAERL